MLNQLFHKCGFIDLNTSSFAWCCSSLLRALFTLPFPDHRSTWCSLAKEKFSVGGSCKACTADFSGSFWFINQNLLCCHWHDWDAMSVVLYVLFPTRVSQMQKQSLTRNSEETWDEREGMKVRMNHQIKGWFQGLLKVVQSLGNSHVAINQI